MVILKKYKLEVKLLLVIIFIFYFLPINVYLVGDIDSANFSNLLYIINPITLFICSVIDGRYRSNFYILPIIAAGLFIPLSFTIYQNHYLWLFFIYLAIGICGGMLGCWCADKEDVRKSFKKAIGIMCVIAAIFSIIFTIANFVIISCVNNTCDYLDIFSVENIEMAIFIVVCIILGRYCFKKKKKD